MVDIRDVEWRVCCRLRLSAFTMSQVTMIPLHIAVVLKKYGIFLNQIKTAPHLLFKKSGSVYI